MPLHGPPNLDPYFSCPVHLNLRWAYAENILKPFIWATASIEHRRLTNERSELPCFYSRFTGPMSI